MTTSPFPRPLLRRAPLALLTLWFVVAACAHAPSGGGVALRVDTNVADATVWVDDILVGRAAEWTGEGPAARHLRPGFHRVEVRAPGYYSVFREIDQPEGGRVTVAAPLRPLLD
jgi:PEGA domain